MEKSAKIYVAGHNGLVGSALVRHLEGLGYTNLLTRTSSQLDLRNQADTLAFFEQQRPDYVFLAAARVGGIHANNTYKAEFIYNNLAIATNVIDAAHRNGCKKLLNLGSSCIYPRLAEQPLVESSLLSGPLEPTNEPYALAKISAIKLCRYYNEQYGTDFISAMPTNLYGPRDNFDLQNSHVLPAMIRKVHEAKLAGAEGRVELWGDGSARREFLYVDDLADACVFLMNNVSAADLKNSGLIDHFVNVGTGEDLTIKALASRVVESIGYTGEISWDTSKPNGTPRKLLDVSRMKALGWEAQTTLGQGLDKVYSWFCEHYAEVASK